VERIINAEARGERFVSSLSVSHFFGFYDDTSEGKIIPLAFVDGTGAIGARDATIVEVKVKRWRAHLRGTKKD
jgi:hypothetical protein